MGEQLLEPPSTVGLVIFQTDKRHGAFSRMPVPTPERWTTDREREGVGQITLPAFGTAAENGQAVGDQARDQPGGWRILHRLHGGRIDKGKGIKAAGGVLRCRATAVQ